MSKKLIAQVLSDNEDERIKAAKDENATVELLCHLSNDADVWVQHAVAVNKVTPLNILRMLANCGKSIVTLGVIHNVNTPNWLLEEILDSSLYSTNQYLEAIALKPNITQDVIVKIYRKTIATIDRHHRSNFKIYGQNVFSALLQNTLTPIDIIREINKVGQYQ